jgi:hypothetical protein
MQKVMQTSTSGGNQLTTIQITKKTLRKVRAYCRKNRFIQRYWLESLLENAVKKERGAANRNRSPNEQ